MENLKVMITGAAGGLGSELAIQLAELGANLLLLDKDSRKLDQLSDKICSYGFDEPGVCALHLGHLTQAQIENLSGVLREEYRGLDVFIHCAATFEGLQPIEQVSAEHWDQSLKVNVISARQCVVSFLDLLKESGKGRVLLIQEDSNVCTSAYRGAYGVSKAALDSFGKILAEEFQGTKIKVLNLYPGPMRTALRAKSFLAEDPNLVPHPAEAAKKIVEQLQSSYAD
jgi:NAD(P)-dependent dehydrogenase (short-subunit alcohol dehydrogenase family)